VQGDTEIPKVRVLKFKGFIEYYFAKGTDPQKWVEYDTRTFFTPSRIRLSSY
jgi:hypothetical protein